MLSDHFTAYCCRITAQGLQHSRRNRIVDIRNHITDRPARLQMLGDDVEAGGGVDEAGDIVLAGAELGGEGFARRAHEIVEAAAEEFHGLGLELALELIEVGPAHTKGDVIVHVPGDRVVYTGDILFIGGHPVVWEGPFSNWIAACERIEAMDVDAIVPGHGPLTDKAGVRRLREYLHYVQHEARKRYDAGMSAFAAAKDIALDGFADWGDVERMVVNVDTLYREFAGAGPRKSVVPCFAAMARFGGKARSQVG